MTALNWRQGLSALRKSYRNVAHLEKQVFRTGSVFLQVATEHEIEYEVCHSIWSKSGKLLNYLPPNENKIKVKDKRKVKNHNENRWPQKFTYIV